MKLHLPLSLFRSVLAAMSVAAATCFSTVEAATLHKDISITTYADFGQNMGRYAVGNTSALQTHLSNTQGVQIVYTGGQAPVTLPHGMIDFGSASSAGNTALLGHNWMATVQHVNWGISTNYSARYIGADNATQYKEIICWGSPKFNHNMQNDGSYTANSTDYRVSRINKLVTDVDGSALFYGNEASLNGQYLYRVGAGYTYKQQEDGSDSYVGMPITGGVGTIDAVPVAGQDRYRIYLYYYDSSSAGVNEDSPAPFNSKPGDSGSPAWVWNAENERYEYVGALEGATGSAANCYRGADEWTKNIMEKYNVSVSADGGSVLHMSAVNTQGETIADSQNSTTLYSGAVTDAAGNEIARYNGVQQGRNTWSDLSGLKDTQQWYAYGEEYMNSADVPMADLFYNSNLIFSAGSADKVSIVLDDTVDLGVGYVQFKPSAEGATAEFDISSASGESNLLNSAGFIVDKGASVHLKLTNPADYMREWRKVGEGALYIEGSGNNDIFLNVGGSGSTFLNRDGGYATYNVLVNNGSTVVIRDTSQIARDLTFGNRGGVLDLNGNSMYWNNDDDASAAGFTIHALDEQAIITNTKGSDGLKPATSTLTWTQSGEQTWLGSFVDTKEGALKFVYDSNPWGNTDASLTMHSIHTDLSHNAASGIEVWSGTLALQGRNTVHAENSLTGTNGTRYFHEDDWHYADAKANVTVLGGAFELGSHARLTGNVNVQYGTFIMREGVKHQMEYIEGGYAKEDTDNIRDYFGLKGNVTLASGTQMLVQFSEGTDSTLEYGYQISGSGSLSVEVGTDGGVLHLTGDNSGHTGTKTLVSGGLHAASADALGDTTTHKWLIERNGWLVSDSFISKADIDAAVDTASSGVLALTHTIADDLTAAGYTHLIVGAAEGMSVEYGTADASLTAVDGKWTLGGGGGNLIVNFLLEGNNKLVLGTEHGKGNVHLTNTNNTFSGGLEFAGGVTLTAEEGALGNSAVALGYSNRLAFRDASMLGVLEPNADGVLLVDNGVGADINLSTQPALYLGSENDCRYTGNLTVAEGAAYRFGGSTGVLTVDSQLEAGHDVVIDGQTYEGGTVVLTNAQAVDGAVTVIGRDTTRTNESAGSATLGFEGDNALSNAASFTVKDGGNIDLMGTTQKLNNLSLGEGSTLSDSVGSGVATLNGSTTLEGTVTAGHVIKTGDGALSLGGTNTATRFEIQGGAATLMSSTATHAAGTLAVSNASLELNGQTVNGTIELGDGASLTNMNTIGSLHVVGDSQGSCRNADGSAMNAKVTIDTLTVESGAKFTMTASSVFESTTINSLSGAGDVTLNFAPSTSTNYLATWIKGNNSSFTGQLTLEGNNTNAGAYFLNWSSLGSGVVSFNGAQFYLQNHNSAETAIQATLDVGEKGVYLNEAGRTHVAYFTGLSGTGTVQSSSTVTFLGDMTKFSGTLQLPATFGGTGSNYHTITGNNSTGAINLFATGAEMSSGGTYQFNYSDDVILNAKVLNGNVTQSGSGTLVLSEANTSAGTLTINEGGTVWLAEGGSWAGKLAGAGTLRNSTNATIASASDFSGSLSLDQGSKLSITSGSLYVGGQYGHIYINAVEGATGGAELNVSNLVLSEATRFHFSANALLDEHTASLHLTQGNVSTEYDGHPYVFITDTQNLATGNYLLVSGDWSQVNINESYPVELDKLFNASLTTDTSGLHLTISVAEGAALWKGTASQHEWNESTFGTATTPPTGEQTIYFTNVAQEHHVNISGTVEAGTLYFNTSADDYRLSGTGNLTASGINLSGGGTVTIGEGVILNGTTTIAADSEVVLNNFSTFSSSASATGAGTLTVDAGNSASGSLSANLTGLTNLQLKSGRLETVSAPGASNVMVAGGQYYIKGGTHANTISLSGTGWAGSEHADAALRLEGDATLSGSLTLTSDATMAVTGSGATISGSINTGDYTLTKTGDSMLILTGNSVSGNLDVHAGTLRIDGQPTSGIKALTLRENSTLLLQNAGSKFAADSIVMEDGSRINLRNGNSDGAQFSANIALTGTATLAGSINGNNTNVQGTIKGDGTLQLAQYGGTNTWRISSDISEAEGGKLAVVANSYVQLYGDNSYTGGTTVNGSTLTAGHENALGGGALTVNGGLVQQHTDLLISTLDGVAAAHVSTNGKVLTLGNGTTADDTASFAGTLDGAGTLVKIGEGVQELTGSVTQTAIDVQSGTLAFNGASVNAAVSVAEGGTLSLAGNLTLAQAITSEGIVSLQEGLHFNLNSTTFNGYDATTNSYTLISGGLIEYADSGFSFTVNGFSSADLEVDTYSIDYSDNRLTITLGDLMNEVTWNGQGESDVWSTDKSQRNWQQGESASFFNSLDIVTFGSEGSRSVTVADKGVKVASLTVTGTDYVFSGGNIRSLGNVNIAAGASADFENTLTVEGDLTVAGTAVLGDVNLSGTLTSTGNLTVNGTAEFANASITKSLAVGDGAEVSAHLTSSAFSGAVSVGENATLALNGSRQEFNNTVTLKEGATLSLATTSGRSQFSNALNLEGNATIHYTTGQDLLVDNVLNGNNHTITKTGEGLLWLAPTSASNVSFIVEEGKLRVGGAAAKAIPTGIDSITLRAGAELSFTADTSTFATNLTLDGGSSLDLKGTNANEETYTFTGEMSLGKGTVTLNPNATRTLVLDGKVSGSGALAMGSTGTLTLELNNAANDFSGGISVANGSTLKLGNASAAGTGTITLGDSTSSLVYAGSETESFSTLSNAVTGDGAVTITSGKLELTNATLTGPLAVGQNAALSLSATGVTISGATTLAEGAELVVQSFSATGSSITGKGTLSVNAGDAASGKLAADLTGLGTLQLLSGRYEAGDTTLPSATGIVVSGGQYYITGGTHSNSVELGGSGWGGNDTHKAAALRLEGGATLSGGLTLSGAATMAVTGSGATISGAVNTGDYTLAKTGSAMLTLYTDDISGHIDVQTGVLKIWGQAVSGNLQSLTLRNGTTLNVGQGNSGARLKAGAIHMEDGSKILLYNGKSTGGIFETDLKLTGTATLSAGINGNDSAVTGTITGNGTLQLAWLNYNPWQINSEISDAQGGSLALTANSLVTLNEDNSYSGGTTVTGNTLTTGHANALGGGALTINGGTVKQNEDLLISTLDGTTSGTINTNGKALMLGYGTTEADTATYAGDITGGDTGRLEKVGAGTQVLTGNITLNRIDVTEGTLSLNGPESANFSEGIWADGGTLALHNVTMSGYAEAINSGRLELSGDIDVSATIAKGIRILTGGSLLLTDANVTGNISIIGSDSSAELAGNVGLSTAITASGSVTLSEGLNIILSDNGSNTYNIITGNAEIDNHGFAVTIGNTRYEADNYTIATESGLSITLLELGRDLSWNGQQSDVWQTGSTETEWQAGSEAEAFRSQDNVTFGSEGSSKVAIDTAGVKVASMEVTGAGYDFSGGAINNLGDMTVSAGASADFDSDVTVEGKLTVAGDVAFRSEATLSGTVEVAAGGKLSLGDAESTSAQSYKLEGLALSGSGNTTLEFAGDTTIGETYRTLGDKNSAADDNAVTITLAGGSTVKDDAYWSMYGGSLTITGEGVYEVNGICLSRDGQLVGTNTWRGPQSTLTINEGATLEITGTDASNTDNIEANKPSFDLGVWNTREDNKDVRNLVTVNGSLISNAGFSVKDGKADVNVGENGMLAMVNGLGLVRDSGEVAVNVEGTLALGGTSNTAGKLTVTLKNGATLAAWGGEDATETVNVTVNTAFSIDEDTALNFKADGKQQLTVNSDLQNANSITAKGSGKIQLTKAAASLSSVTLEENAHLSLANDSGNSFSISQATLGQGSALSTENGGVTLGGKTPEPDAATTFATGEATLTNVLLAAESLAAADVNADAEAFGARIDITASEFSVSGINLVDSAVALQSTALELNNVVMAGGSTVIGESPEESIVAMEGVTLALTDATCSYVTGDSYGEAYSGKTIAVYTLDSFSSVKLSGSLSVDFSALPAAATANSTAVDYYAIDFGSSNELADTLSVNANLGEDGDFMDGVHSGTVFLFAAPAKAIPEPATSALALLGLGALAARRRRK